MNQSFTNTTLAAQTATDPAFTPQNKSKVYFASSRNPIIDSDIEPGPYKEVLPCESLCYDLVQSCPASLQFVCPLEKHGLNYTYGKPSAGVVSCSFPGAGINGISAAWRLGIPSAWACFGVALALMVTCL